VYHNKLLNPFRLFLFLLVPYLFACTHKEPVIQKDCMELKAQGLIDSFPYPVRPGSEEWKKFTSYQQMVDAVTVPDEILGNMCTLGLVYTCVYCPLFMNLMVCNHIPYCFDMLKEQINSFDELVKREDAGSELMDLYLVLFDTSKAGTNLLDAQFLIHTFETFISQRDLLGKLNDHQSEKLLADAYERLIYKQDHNLSWTFISSSYYLLANILYFNLTYPPFVDLVDRNDMLIFLNDQMYLDGQPVDSIPYFTQQFLGEI